MPLQGYSKWKMIEIAALGVSCREKLKITYKRVKISNRFAKKFNFGCITGNPFLVLTLSISSSIVRILKD